jgi:hypothetical protein
MVSEELVLFTRLDSSLRQRGTKLAHSPIPDTLARFTEALRADPPAPGSCRDISMSLRFGFFSPIRFGWLIINGRSRRGKLVDVTGCLSVCRIRLHSSVRSTISPSTPPQAAKHSQTQHTHPNNPPNPQQTSNNPHNVRPRINQYVSIHPPLPPQSSQSSPSRANQLTVLKATPPPKSTTSPPQTSLPAARVRPKSSPAACAKKRKPRATSACCSPRPKTPKPRARIWSPSTAVV